MIAPGLNRDGMLSAPLSRCRFLGHRQPTTAFKGLMVGGMSPVNGPVGVSAMPCPGSVKADAVRSGFHEISGHPIGFDAETTARNGLL